MSTRIGAWKLRSTLSGGENFVAISCDVCHGQMSTAEPTAAFLHCGHRDIISPALQDILLGRGAPGHMTSGEQLAAANLVAAEKAIAAQKPQYFDEHKAWEQVAAAVEFGARADAAKKWELQNYDLTGPSIPRQPTGKVEYVPFDPNVKTV